MQRVCKRELSFAALLLALFVVPLLISAVVGICRLSPSADFSGASPDITLHRFIAGGAVIGALLVAYAIAMRILWFLAGFIAVMARNLLGRLGWQSGKKGAARWP